MLHIGIDPGKKGGLVALTEAGEVAYTWKLEDATEADIAERLRQAADGGAFAWLEKVHAMPGQGVASTFTFGRGFGFVLGCLAALKIPHELVTPHKWQKAMGCLTGGDKNVSKAAAQRLWPGTKITHANADALLIAEFGRRVTLGRKG